MKWIPTALLAMGIHGVIASNRLGSNEDVAEYLVDFWHLIEEDPDNTVMLYKALEPVASTILTFAGERNNWRLLWDMFAGIAPTANGSRLDCLSWLRQWKRWKLRNERIRMFSCLSVDAGLEDPRLAFPLSFKAIDNRIEELEKMVRGAT
jgi:hypothetical protein